LQPDQTSPLPTSISLASAHPRSHWISSLTMVAETRHDTSLYHTRRQSPPIRVGVVPKPNNTTKYVVTGIFAVLALIVCSVTIYLWLKYRRRNNYKAAKFNEAAGQAWKLDDQLPQHPTPDADGKPGYGGKGGHDAGPEQEPARQCRGSRPRSRPIELARRATILPFKFLIPLRSLDARADLLR
jgi:hypothetical protein